MPHPGEKRLLNIVKNKCSKIPNGIFEDIENIFKAMSKCDNSILKCIDNMVKALDTMLIDEKITVI